MEIRSVGYENPECVAHREWVKHYNKFVKNGEMFRDLRAENVAKPSLLFTPPAIPTCTERYATFELNRALRYLKKGNRKEYAQILMWLRDSGFEDLIRRTLKTLKL